MLRPLLGILMLCSLTATYTRAEEPSILGGFTVRVADLLAADAMKPLASALFENMPDFAEGMKTNTGFTPEQLSRVSFVYSLTTDGQPYERDVPVFVYTPTNPFDKAAILKATGAEEVVAAGSIGEHPKLSMHLKKYGGILAVTDKQVFDVKLFVARKAMMVRPGEKAPPPEKPTISAEMKARAIIAIQKATAIDTARATAMKTANELIAGDIDVPAMLIDANQLKDERMPAVFLPLKAAKSARAGLSLVGSTMTVTAEANFADAVAANAGLTAAKKGITLGNAFLEVSKYERDVANVPGLVQILDILTTAIGSTTTVVNGTNVVATAKMEVSPTTTTILLKALAGTRTSAQQMKAINNFKQIGIAMHIHNDTMNALPENVYAADKKTALLSWRVQILPFIEQDALYREFKLDESWDSEHNKKLIAKMPNIYGHPVAKTDVVGGTFTQAFVGEVKHRFRPTLIRGEMTRMTIQGIQDGSSQTFLVAEAATAVPWTKPDDMAFDPDGPRAKVGSHWPDGGFIACFGDGSVRMMPKTLTDKVLKFYIQINDGEVIPAINPPSGREVQVKPIPKPADKR